MKRIFVRLLLLKVVPLYIVLSQPGVTSQTYSEIEAKVAALFGPVYEVDAVNFIDSGLVLSSVQNASLQDPYGSLKGCFVFAAVGKFREDGHAYKGFMGIYSEGEIIWHSDTVIDNEFARSATIAATMDLNNDGTVEIVSDWSEDSHRGPEYLWIFSWDGFSGRQINAVDQDGQSIIVSLGWQFEFADLNGDGILEIKGFWSEDLDKLQHAKSPVTYSWNGQLYGKWPSSPQPLPGGYLPRNRVSVTVSASVSKPQSNLYRFRYIIFNHPESKQPVDEFDIGRRTSSITNSTARAKWNFALLRKSLAGWNNVMLYPNYISQGIRDSSFSFETDALPTIVNYFVRGSNPSLDQPAFEEESWYQDVISNSGRGFTLGPADPPSPFVTSAFVDTLLSYTKQARSLNWIDSDGLANSFSQKLQNAKEQLSKGNANAARNTLQALLNEVEAQKEKHLTSEAYALLKFNAEYLISKL